MKEHERTPRDDLEIDLHVCLSGTVESLTTADRDLFTSSDIHELENAAQRLIALAASLRHNDNREAA
jgi:hypothetical protein